MDNHNNSITEEDAGDPSFILCSICHMTEEIYQRVNVRTFMTLNCGHSFCTRCIEQYLQLHAHRCRLCPMCRVPIEHVMRSAFMDEVANHRTGTLRARTRGVRCPRCRLPMDETRTPCAIQPCGHMICTDCRNERTCPTCSIPIHPTAVTIDYLAQQLLARNHELDALTPNMSTLSTSEEGATAGESQDYGPHVRSLVELHDVVHKNLQHLSTWPAVDARDEFERACPAGVHQQIYNRLMQLTQEAVLDGATQEDFMALGLPTFIHSLVFPLMEQVTRCVEARRHRMWTRGLDVHIFYPRPALLSPQR